MLAFGWEQWWLMMWLKVISTLLTWNTLIIWTCSECQTRSALQTSPAHLGHDVDGAQQQLVQVAVLHQAGAVDQRVLETGPDLQPELIGDPQHLAQLPQTVPHQDVHLSNQHAATLMESIPQHSTQSSPSSFNPWTGVDIKAPWTIWWGYPRSYAVSYICWHDSWTTRWSSGATENFVIVPEKDTLPCGRTVGGPCRWLARNSAGLNKYDRLEKTGETQTGSGVMDSMCTEPE